MSKNNNKAKSSELDIVSPIVETLTPIVEEGMKLIASLIQFLLKKLFQYVEVRFFNRYQIAPIKARTIQINYREAQRKSGIPYTGTHILRHGMAKLARKVGGGLDAVLAMTGHKDLKLADHYSKSNEDDQKDFSEMIMKHIRKELTPKTEEENLNNVFRLKLIKSS